MDITDILITILIIFVTAFGAASLFGLLYLKKKTESDIAKTENRISAALQKSAELFRNTVSDNQKNIGNMQTSKFREMDIVIKDMYDTMENRLERLNKSMGEIHGLASGVDDLKKVLSNVKARGILGELQLESILKEILAPEQYEKNIITVPGSRNPVEFAIKLPGKDDGSVYLPIDSKFPLDAYYALCDARDECNSELTAAASKTLSSRLKGFAKDIHTKYIAPPHTTDFGIMFLPSEGLYLEAVNMGLVEALQREYKINIAGPSTLAAMLNALQMGFRTLAVEKKSVYVWETLSEVRTEFEKFADILEASKQRIHQTEEELDKLIGVRTRAILRKLNKLDSDKNP